MTSKLVAPKVASKRTRAAHGAIRVGIGGWTFEPWRGVFYPKGLPHKRELEFASRALSSIEINGTFYSIFKQESWRKWHDETPDDFLFSVKASRYCTNRKVLAEAGPGIERFIAQGLTQLGAKLGPIVWQFAATKHFEDADFEAFLALLPTHHDGIALQHALDVRHPSFATKAFYALAQKYGCAIVFATGKGVPEIDEATAPFTYARIMTSRDDLENGFAADDIKAIAARARIWRRRGNVFLYFISGAKIRDPAAAQALIAALDEK